MDNLEIIYYLDKQQKKIELLVKEINDNDNKKYIINIVNHLIDKLYQTEKEEKEKAKFFVIMRYYIDLLRKEVPYEDVDNLLRSEFVTKYQSPKAIRFLDSLVLHQEALKEANQKYQIKEIYGLTDFYSYISELYNHDEMDCHCILQAKDYLYMNNIRKELISHMDEKLTSEKKLCLMKRSK